MTIPRGAPGQAGIPVEMSCIYEAEKRLKEVAFSSPGTAAELMGYFNDACNTATKYLAWIKYEILQAKKHLELARAEVILDRSMQEFEKYKASGMKYNEDFRNALVIRDSQYQHQLDILNSLQALEAMIESKAKSFERAHYAAKVIWDKKGMTAASPNLSATDGQTDASFFGSTSVK